MLNLQTAIHALSPAQKRVFDSGVYYYDTESTYCDNEPAQLLGNDNLEKIFNFFRSKGLSNEQAAGIAGNASQESGGNPAALSPSGYRGIFQWDKNNRWPRLVEWTGTKGFDSASLEGQLEFAWYEANNGPRGDIINGIKNYNDVPHTTWYWGRYFEGAIIGGSSNSTPLENVQELEQRTTDAGDILFTYGGGDLSGLNTVFCAGGNGQDTRYIDGFTIYSQYDPEWKDLPFGTSTIAESGCGPSAMAMIITALTGKNVTPAETARVAGDNGMYIPGVGSSGRLAPFLSNYWGLKSEAISQDVVSITKALREGKLVITSGRGAKPFTTEGHLLVIRAVTADGKFMVGDSGHRDTNDTPWDPEELILKMQERLGSAYAVYK